MTAIILDGKQLAQDMRGELAEEVTDFFENNSITPKLAAVLVGEDPASEVYVRNKQIACQKAGIESELHRLDADTAEDDLLALITRLNKDNDVHGILVQLPLPGHISTERILRAVNPMKDVDAFHPENVGLLVQGRPRYLPCTPSGVREILRRYEVPTVGKHIVIAGRSDIVGKPLANMLLTRGADGDATVTVCHSKTSDLAEITRTADILVAAIGRPRMLTAEMIKPGAVVVDVGINRTEDGLVGDVDFDGAKEIASHITPVPRGVGPMTVTMLLFNTLQAARLQAF
ncbi:MAG: bifunctional methylenetetrahydrofolate dehydrogenase/methenyltetrahydrofolate cyclohydrolase FolD [Pirellulales bacterium]|nr:bifunctional methylenetetrahydrofolate dehydrogenase/methenyltetrahydrofolate cyclohydrolase FolD [Pirellulales bacterium]